MNNPVRALFVTQVRETVKYCSSGGSILALNSYFHLSPRSLFISEMYPVNGAGYSRTLLSWLEVSAFEYHPFCNPKSFTCSKSYK